LTPLNRSLRVLPRHLHPAKSGAAAPPIRLLVDEVVSQVKQITRLMVLIVARIDGDEGDGTYFEMAFASIPPFLIAAQFDEEFHQFISAQQPFWVSHWLHFMKNARTRLFRTKTS
jgi:hypothetical protein